MFTDDDVRERAKDSREMLRAQELVRRGKVQEFRFVGDDGMAEATMKGSSTYRTWLRPDLTGNCSCPQYRRSGRQFCKHMAALALVVLRERQGLVTSEADADPELVAAVEKLELHEARQLLVECAGRMKGARERILTGEWREE